MDLSPAALQPIATRRRSHRKAGPERAGWIRPCTQALPGLQSFLSAFNEVLAVLGI